MNQWRQEAIRINYKSFYVNYLHIQFYQIF